MTRGQGQGQGQGQGRGRGRGQGQGQGQQQLQLQLQQQGQQQGQGQQRCCPKTQKKTTYLEGEVALAGAGQLPAPEGLGATEELPRESTSILIGDARELLVGLGPDLELGFVGVGLLEGVLDGNLRGCRVSVIHGNIVALAWFFWFGGLFFLTRV
jgi:hypothetical protein